MRISSLALSLLAVPLLACTGGERADTGKCPAGEVCSPATPYGVHFIGNPMADSLLGAAFGPAATAIGGTQEVALEYDRGDGLLRDLDMPFSADDDGGRGIMIDHTSGNVVTIRGAGSRANYLRIVDPTDDSLYDRYELAGASLDRIELVATDFESIPAGLPLVWATGDQRIGIGLLGDVQHGSGPVAERLVDTSMQLALAGSQRTTWDELRLPSATVGAHALSVTAGAKPTANLSVEVVDHADSLALQGPASPSVHTGNSASICFSPLSANRFIVGLSWHFTVDGSPIAAGNNEIRRNCVDIDAVAGRVTPIEVTASAGGKSANVSVLIDAPALATTPTAPAQTGYARTTPTAGERAAM